MREKIRTHPLGFVLVWMGLYLIAFYLTGHILTPRYEVAVAFDDRIPFCAPFVIFYKAWFLYFPGILILDLKKHRREYFELAFVLLTGMTLSVIFYALFPNAFSGRPVILKDDIFSKAVQSLFETDPPTNAFPSIHAGSSMAVLLVTAGSREMRKNRPLVGLCGLMTTLISLSTLFIKQHSVIDMLSGFALNALLFVLYCRTERGRRFIDSLL